MKKCILLFLAILCAYSCTMCDQPHQKIKNKEALEAYNTEIKYNIISETDSLFSFKCRLIAFPTIKNQKLLKAIYNLITVNKNYWDFTDYSPEGLLQAIKMHKQNLAEKDETRKWLLEKYKDNDGGVIQTVRDYGFLDDITLDIFSISGDFVIVEFKFLGGRGGVGWETENYLTFDKNTEQILTISDVLKKTQNNKEWDEILRKRAGVVIINSMSSGGEMMPVYGDEMIPVSKNFYFDKNSITFVYDENELSSGIVYIRIPYYSIWEYLKPKFIKEYLQ